MENNMTPVQVFFNLHNYIEDEMPDSVIWGYMWYDIIYYIIVALLGFLYLDFNFWNGLLFLLPLLFVEHCIAYLYFYLYPRYLSKTRDIKKIEDRIKKLRQKEKYWDDKDSYDSFFDSSTIYSIRRYYSICQNSEKDYLNEIKKELAKEQEVLKTQNIETTRDTRIAKLETYKKLVETYISEHNISDIECIDASIEKLLDTVNHKPAGVKLISNNLFVYFNELKYILDKFITLNQENKEKYQENIIEIAKSLTSNIEEICDNIEKFETDDIEVSMKILLQELKDTKNLKISDTTTQLINVENEIFNGKETN